MDCSDIRELLQEFIDGEAEPDLTAEIEEHLAKCRSCKREFEGLKMLQEMVQQTDAPARIPSEDFFQNAFKTAYGKSKANPGGEKIQRFLQNIEIFIQRLLFGNGTGYRFARAACLLFVGVAIGTSVFHSKPAGDIAKNQPEKYSLETVEINKNNSQGKNELNENILSQLPSGPKELDHIDKGVKDSLNSQNSITATPFIGPRLPNSEQSNKAAAFNNPNAPALNFLASVFSAISKNASQAQGDKNLVSQNGGNEDKLTAVANNIKSSELLNDLQNMKLSLYLSGDEKYIPDVHKVEEVIYEIMSSNKGEQNQVEAFRVYQKAEESLLSKNYFEAIKNYYNAARMSPNSHIAFLSYFQLANIDFEALQNFRSALSNYEKCLEKFPSHFLTDEKKNLILARVDLLTKNSQDNWQPLSVFLQAKNTSSPDKAKGLYLKMINDYPKAPLALEAIKNLISLTCADTDDNQIQPSEIVEFFQSCLDSDKFDSPIKELMQLGIGDIFNFRLKDANQARIEYSRLIQGNVNSQYTPVAQSRIRRLNTMP